LVLAGTAVDVAKRRGDPSGPAADAASVVDGTVVAAVGSPVVATGTPEAASVLDGVVVAAVESSAPATDAPDVLVALS
jgi:hypothetical protein